ncbi:hypothetical protein [Streptomyces antibioticus]|uniref:hypothetical protein n=1 Tax=Streptomyces antibioticus TaxID=1890 RepID=UPI0033B93BC7
MDIGALVGGGVALLVGVLSWTQSRATNRRSDFTAITERLDRELKDERTQRKLLTSFVLDLLRWAQRVEPDSQAGPPPSPPTDLDLSPWRR